MPGEQLQHFAGIRSDAALERSPVPPADRGIKSRDLKMFFNVECEAMQRRAPYAQDISYKAARERVVALMVKRRSTVTAPFDVLCILCARDEVKQRVSHYLVYIYQYDMSFMGQDVGRLYREIRYTVSGWIHQYGRGRM